jgi:redox-sensitive bicupin YhaK (pirin superfamily)
VDAPRVALRENDYVMTDSIDIRRADTRPHTQIGWLDSWHCFSFGNHYDPTNTHHGLLLVSNDDTVEAGSGFTTHSHQDMEIVTWVLAGRLLHKDSGGNEGELYPGLAQRMSAGTGISHSEMNASSTEAVHFIQMWVPPDTNGIQPSYEQRDVNDELDKGGLQPVASGQGHPGAISIHQGDAVLWVGRLAPDEVVSSPDAPHTHIFVARGQIHLDAAGDLDEGDAARLTNAGPLLMKAGPAGVEVLIWATA